MEGGKRERERGRREGESEIEAQKKLWNETVPEHLNLQLSS